MYAFQYVSSSHTFGTQDNMLLWGCEPLAPPRYSPTAVWWREDYMGPLCW